MDADVQAIGAIVAVNCADDLADDTDAANVTRGLWAGSAAAVDDSAGGRIGDKGERQHRSHCGGGCEAKRTRRKVRGDDCRSERLALVTR